MKTVVHECGCGRCREDEANGTRELHAELNAFLSTLDEEKRLQFLGLESMNAGYGGDQQLELITGVKAVEIARRRWSIQQIRLGRPAYILESLYAENKPGATSFTYFATKDRLKATTDQTGRVVGPAGEASVMTSSKHGRYKKKLG